MPALWLPGRAKDVCAAHPCDVIVAGVYFMAAGVNSFD